MSGPSMCLWPEGPQTEMQEAAGAVGLWLLAGDFWDQSGSARSLLVCATGLQTVKSIFQCGERSLSSSFITHSRWDLGGAGPGLGLSCGAELQGWLSRGSYYAG